MTDDTNDFTFDRSVLPSLRMPGQAAPIQRAGSPGGSASGDGVEADWGSVNDWLNVAGGLASSLRGI